MLGVALAAFFAFMYAYRRSPRMQYTADRVLLKVPVLGNVLHSSSIARFARTLAVTFKAGVPLVEAMESVAGATGNRVYTNTVLEMRYDVAAGSPLNVALKQGHLFPNMRSEERRVGKGCVSTCRSGM